MRTIPTTDFILIAGLLWFFTGGAQLMWREHDYDKLFLREKTKAGTFWIFFVLNFPFLFLLAEVMDGLPRVSFWILGLALPNAVFAYLIKPWQDIK